MKNKIPIVNIGFLIQDINSFLRNKKSMFPEGHLLKVPAGPLCAIRNTGRKDTFL